MFNIQVAFHIDINCPCTLGVHHKIFFQIKHNLYVQQRVGFVCLFSFGSVIDLEEKK